MGRISSFCITNFTPHKSQTVLLKIITVCKTETLLK